MAIHLAFFAILGVFLSVFCRAIFSAYGALLLTLLGGPLFVYVLLKPNPNGLAAEILTVVNPASCWIAIGLDWRLTNDENAADWSFRNGQTIKAMLLSLGSYIAAASVLWLLTWRRFAEEPSRAS